MFIYTVRPGDTVTGIANQFGTDPVNLIRLNGLQDPNRLVVGEDLVIPGNYNRYTVERGDSLYSIALASGVTLEELLAANPDLREPYMLFPGDVLNIPKPAKSEIAVNSYIYPSISPSVLERSLPFLTWLSIFSYRVDAEGSLTAPNDAELTDKAASGGVAPVMVITNTKESGGFSTDVVNTLINDREATFRLAENCLGIMRERGYTGLDVDFEYISPDNRESYIAFMEYMAGRMHDEGYTISTALAPKLTPTQKGILYEAHDYGAMGRICDRIILMTYEWGYIAGPPLAVAPLSEVEKVISYAVTEIPRNKILMGIPNYGYDWTLPYREGTRAKILTNNEAVNLARRFGAEIEYNNMAQSPFFRYYDNFGAAHIVWFENARSIAAKLNLVREYDLLGISYWTGNSYFAQNFLVLDDMFRIKKV